MANAPRVSVRGVTATDLPVHFAQQCDPESNRMAAVPARDRASFDAHWQRNLANPECIVRTVEWDGKVVGSVVSWRLNGQRLVGYWIGREYWGRGIATAALAEFLLQFRERPLHAHVIRHNTASLRVLQKCGFQKTNDVDGEEFILQLIH